MLNLLIPISIFFSLLVILFYRSYLLVLIEDKSKLYIQSRNENDLLKKELLNVNFNSNSNLIKLYKYIRSNESYKNLDIVDILKKFYKITILIYLCPILFFIVSLIYIYFEVTR